MQRGRFLEKGAVWKEIEGGLRVVFEANIEKIEKLLKGFKQRFLCYVFGRKGEDVKNEKEIKTKKVSKHE
jgi:hypothetical protein